VRAVLDANVLISAVLSSRGPSADLLRQSREGVFELIVSELLLAEVARAPTYPKLRKRISAENGTAFISWLRDHGTLAEDPTRPPSIGSPDPDDDYLIALAIDQSAFLVSGDQHLLGLRADLPIHPPAQFLAQLREED